MEAWQLMSSTGVTALLVISNQDQPLGVISRARIEDYYNHKQTP